MPRLILIFFFNLFYIGNIFASEGEDKNSCIWENKSNTPCITIRHPIANLLNF